MCDQLVFDTKVSKMRLHPQGQRPRGYLFYIPSRLGKQGKTRGKGLNNANLGFCYLYFEIRGWRPRICKIFEITKQFIQTVKGQNNFWQQNVFLTCSWRFFTSNKLEQLEFKFRKIIGSYKHAEKVRKRYSCNSLIFLWQTWNSNLQLTLKWVGWVAV